MAPIVRSLLIPLLATVTTAAVAATPGVSDRRPSAPAEPKAQDRKPSPSLDELYGRLRDSEDDAEAKGVATLIERRLDWSGSATVDVLTDRARQAMTAQDFALAAELMDRVTAIEPAWSEGWNRRATVFWLLTDRQSAIADLQRALVLEPRHFEAWAALGRIYLSLEDKTRALNAYRRAIAIYPRMPKLKDAMERLAPEVDGRDL